MAKKGKKRKEKVNYIPRIIFGGVCIAVFVTFLIIGIVVPDSIFAKCASLIGRTSYEGADIVNILERVLGTLYYFGLFIGAQTLIRVIIELSIQKADNRVKTVCRLIGSTIKYACSIVWLFITLTLWGVDITTLLVSAGIIALIIGLGAQSLISDIIAGINIVFESEYHVGDLVYIDGFRGTIQEIGLTLTKIVDWSGNVKSINNSKISTVVNLSAEKSVILVDFSIEYTEDLRKVEKIFEDHKQEIKDQIPELLAVPEYLGVNNLGSSSVDLRFAAKVEEEDRYVAQRALTRALYLMYSDNGVYVPFNQLVLSTRNDAGEEAKEKLEEVINNK